MRGYQILYALWGVCPYSKIVCLFVVLRPIPSFFFTHVKTSPLPVNGFNFGLKLVSHVNEATKVLKRATPTVTWVIRL